MYGNRKKNTIKNLDINLATPATQYADQETGNNKDRCKVDDRNKPKDQRVCQFHQPTQVLRDRSVDWAHIS